MIGVSTQRALLLIQCRAPLIRSSVVVKSVRQIIASQSHGQSCPIRTLLGQQRAFATKSKPPNAASSKQPAPRPPPPKRFAQQHKPTSENSSAKDATKGSVSKPQNVTNTSFTGTRGTAPQVPASNTAVYPAQLLVYHAGIPLTVFVATVKFVAIIVFIMTTFAIAPMYYFDPLENSYMALVWFAGGAIPLLMNVFAVPSLITYVHIHLPSWARMSAHRLHQYLQRLPPSAVVDLTAVRWIWPRVSRLSVSELYLQESTKLSLRLKRNVPPEVYAARKWYSWRPIKTFLVAGKSGKVRDDKAWGEMLTTIRRGWAKDPRFQKLNPDP